MGGLVFAWILSWFGFDKAFIKAFYELFGVIITTASYYFIFFAVSALLEIYVAVKAVK